MEESRGKETFNHFLPESLESPYILLSFLLGIKMTQLLEYDDDSGSSRIQES